MTRILLSVMAIVIVWRCAAQCSGFVLAHRQLRRGLLLTPHLWLAALLSVAIQAPVIYWNLTEGLASFRFHFHDRPTANWGDPRFQQVVRSRLSPTLSVRACW